MVETSGVRAGGFVRGRGGPGAELREETGVLNAGSRRRKGVATAGLTGSGDARRGLRHLPLAGGAAEEIWVLARGEGISASEDTPGTGALMAKIEEKQVPMPLKHTDVSRGRERLYRFGRSDAAIRESLLEQDRSVYVFPLPHNAAVNEFIMTIGERRIRGIIRERQEAEQIYQEARRQGYVASLLTEERPNVFTQSVANIEPGKQIDVNIKYFNTLEYLDGWYEFVFPMVVGPRFNPPGSTKGMGPSRAADGQLGSKHGGSVPQAGRTHQPRHRSPTGNRCGSGH